MNLHDAPEAVRERIQAQIYKANIPAAWRIVRVWRTPGVAGDWWAELADETGEVVMTIGTPADPE